MRINASSRMYGTPYKSFIRQLLDNNIELNRKVLAEIAVTEPLTFKSVVEAVRPRVTM